METAVKVQRAMFRTNDKDTVTCMSRSLRLHCIYMNMVRRKEGQNRHGDSGEAARCT
jgi:hypothetical protein